MSGGAPLLPRGGCRLAISAAHLSSGSSSCSKQATSKSSGRAASEGALGRLPEAAMAPLQEKVVTTGG